MSPQLPPPDPSIHPVGKADANTIGPLQLGLLVYYGLRPSDAVLDLGCGIGRLAYKMADFLDPTGSYHGLDISRRAIDWLSTHYSSVLPNFRFTHIDVGNGRYNPKAMTAPTEITFPYDGEAFDIVAAFSLFTHMRKNDVQHYLRETRRVLRPSGRAVVTFFAIDPEQDTTPAYGNKPFVPLVGDEKTWTLDPSCPERGIAYATETIDAMVAGAGLKLVERIPGFWRGGLRRREPPFLYAHQDVYVLAPGAA